MHNALCRATPCVAEGGPVRNALCRRGCLCTTPCVGACACGLVVRATDVFPVSHGLKSQGGLCAQRLVSRGGPVRNALCHRGGACAQRLVSPWGGPVRNALCHRGGALCATPCVTGGRVRNALCRATPCVTEGALVHNALCHRGCLRTTPCVTGGGLVHEL